MAKMTDAELEEYLKEDKPAMMTDDEIAAALNEDVAKPEEMSFIAASALKGDNIAKKD